MLEFYFSYRGVLKRLRSGVLGGEMDRLAEHFFTLGYKRASAKIYLSRIARFSQFAATRCGPMPIHQDVIDSYLGAFTTDTPRIGAVSALGHARRVAPERFIISVQVHGVEMQETRCSVEKFGAISLSRFFATCSRASSAWRPACAKAHHWARELIALGHVVKVDAAGLRKGLRQAQLERCGRRGSDLRAVTRPTMRFVAVKSADAQSILMLHRAGHLLVRRRTAEISTMRAHLAEYGVVTPKGPAHVRGLIEALDKGDAPLPRSRDRFLSSSPERSRIVSGASRHLAIGR